jgi:hypothetical protein
MGALVRVAATMAAILFSGFFAIVLWKLLTGEISLSYLLDADVEDDAGDYSTGSSAGRTQSLMVTLIVASYYLLRVFHDPSKFPKLPNAMLVALAGSHALYLGSKAQSILSGKLPDWLK